MESVFCHWGSWLYRLPCRAAFARRRQGCHRADNLNSYYDPDLKKSRLAELAAYANFHFEKHDLSDRDAIAQLFATISLTTSYTWLVKPEFVIPWSIRMPTPI